VSARTGKPLGHATLNEALSALRGVLKEVRSAPENGSGGVEVREGGSAFGVQAA
jgi:hypothetical protein